MIEWIRKLYARVQEYWKNPAYRTWKKAVISMFGFTVVLLGIAMIVLPGPALIVIPLGLAVLGTEYVWARKLLARLKKEAVRMKTAMPGFGMKGEANGRNQKGKES